MSITYCSGCGKEIVWGKLSDGGSIPLDPRAPVYVLNSEGRAVNAKLLEAAATHGESSRFLVSHFSTCSHVNEFSRRNKS